MKKTIAIILSIMLVLAITLPAAAISTIAVKSITLDNSKITLNVGETSDLKVTFTPANTSQKRLTYTTANKYVATVDAKGKITGVHGGTITIYVYTINKKIFAKCNVTVKKLDFVELSYYMPPPLSPQKNQENVMAEINKQLKQKLNAKLNMNFIDWGAFEQKIQVMSASGEAYDIAFSTSWINKLTLNVAKGAILPLDELLQKYGQTILKRIEPKNWPAVTFNGKKYSIPHPMAYAASTSIVFKKDLVEKYKFDYKSVKSIKDVEPYLQTIKKNEPGIIPLYASETGTTILYKSTRYEGIAGGVCYDFDAKKFISGYSVPSSIENWKILNSFYKKGYIAKDAALKKDDLAEAKSGKYAIVPGQGDYTEDGSKSSGNLGFPCVETLWSTNTIGTGSIQVVGTVISKSSKNPERAMMLIDLLYSDKKFFNTLCYGIEGQDYKVVSGAGTNNPTVETNKDITWVIWHPWIGSLFDQWPSNFNSEAALDKMKRDNDTAVVSPLLGFSFNAEPVKNEVAQLEAITKEINPILHTGSAPDIDKYLMDANDKMTKAGIDKVIAEIQKQVAEWKAANGKK